MSFFLKKLVSCFFFVVKLQINLGGDFQLLSFEERINSKMSSLTISERKVVEQLKMHEQPFLLSMNELSLLSKVSEPSVVRLYRKLGYASYQELKVALAQEQVNNGITSIGNYNEIKDEDLADVVFDKMADQLATAMSMTKEKINVQQMEEAVQIISKADRVFFFGQGLSGNIAEDGAHKFMRMGGTIIAVKDPHYQAIYANHMCKDDVVIVISHSGETVNIIEVVKMSQKSGAFVIVITSNSNTTLAQMADTLLLTQAQETEKRSDAMVSRLVQLALIDTLFTRVVAIGGSHVKESINRSRLAVTRMKK
ncbi:MurR/RpiR family transcriptional regulator [Lysinibacillus varians]|uniref:MurR/RpiR family transcriptional regulator n=1 Tax=Lysinibacillus varians TaxID=1145276 RepID=A0ABY2T8R7_9BACI|nr:MurR/RpiR family transcriptional regulator [Lysinibacillus varians]